MGSKRQRILVFSFATYLFASFSYLVTAIQSVPHGCTTISNELNVWTEKLTEVIEQKRRTVGIIREEFVPEKNEDFAGINASN